MTSCISPAGLAARWAGFRSTTPFATNGEWDQTCLSQPDPRRQPSSTVNSSSRAGLLEQRPRRRRRGWMSHRACGRRLPHASATQSHRVGHGRQAFLCLWRKGTRQRRRERRRERIRRGSNLRSGHEHLERQRNRPGRRRRVCLKLAVEWARPCIFAGSFM